MRAFTSYGLAFLLVLAAGIWLGTGLYVQGGLGPYDSEKTVAEWLEGEDGGPLTELAEASGMQIHPEHATGAEDPALSLAERNAILAAGESGARSVRTQLFTIQQMPLEATLRGHTKSPATRDAVAKTSDTVEEIFVTEGQLVEAGDPICRLSSGTREAAVEQALAAVAQAEAALEKAQNEYNTNASLRERGIASTNSGEAYEASLKLAEANLSAAQVQLEQRQDELENTLLTASAAGVVQRPVANVGDLVTVGGSCATLVQLDPMRFVGAVPQTVINYARTGLKASIRTITGQEAEGEITYIAVSADSATRSYDVEIEFPNPDGAILDGMTAEAHITLGSIPAHLLPQSALTLGDDGQLGVQLVIDNKAQFREVTIVNDTPDGVWVSGLPNEAEVIVIGQEYVTDGQPVIASRQG